MSTRVSARAKSTAAARSIERRAARSDRPKPTASLSRRRPSTTGPPGTPAIAGSSGRATLLCLLAARRRLGEVATRAVAADLADVLLVFEDDTERLVDQLGGQLAGAERQQRRGPVERLGDPGHLREVGLAQPVDEPDDLAGESLGRFRDLGEDDLVLLLGGRVVDPVVQ